MKLKITVPIIAIIFLCSYLPALANGGVNWKVTIKNPTYMQSTVWMKYEKFGIKQTEYRTIYPGGSTTYEFGSWCPTEVHGYIKDDFDGKASVPMTTTDILGNTFGVGFPVCNNSKLKICRVAGGKPNTHTKPGDYTFCKD